MSSGTSAPPDGRGNLVLAAMIVAVSMTFIDQTIVSIAVPQIQEELGLSTTGVQWVVNAYLLSLAALFAFGGRLSDTVGHTRVLVVGVVIFTVASALCGLTPKGDAAEPWIIVCRIVQGGGAALLFPSALAIVVAAFPLRSRGKALALFFGVAGGLTAIGPLLGGYLTEWTWRAIFWVNVPVCLVALVLIAMAKPVTEHRPAPMDYRGLVLIAGGVGLSVLGFQQSSTWGWGDPLTWACIVVGLLLLVVFATVELRTSNPLMDVRIFRIRAFLVENLVLFISMLVFVPIFLFASQYAQISLNQSASEAGVFLLYFFLGFVIAAQVGGRMLDGGGAKRPVVLGCVLAAVGFFLWAQDVTSLRFSEQQWWIVLAGAGVGMMLGPASTDAINRASSVSYGEATGITQTVRNYSAALGIAILGTLQVSVMNNRLVDSLVGLGMPRDRAETTADQIADATHGSGSTSGTLDRIPQFVREDFAHAMQAILYAMSGIMAVAAIVALIGLRSGLQEDLPGDENAEPVDAKA